MGTNRREDMTTPTMQRLLESAALETPAFVFDVGTLIEDAARVREMAEAAGIVPLFAMKSFSVIAGLRAIASRVDGFAASSLFEAQVGRAVLDERQTVHITSPGLRPDEIEAVCATVDYISFNSIGQWERDRPVARGRVHCGLRVNPQRSLVEDARYDPCSAHSKLGVPLDALRAIAHGSIDRLDGIDGVHFHTNADSEDLLPLLQTVEDLLDGLGPLWDRIDWVNLGGGYLFQQPRHQDALQKAADRIRARRPSCRLFIEPGASIVRRAGAVVATVVDLFDSHGKTIAMLDTSVNHMPEVFEYQFEPDVAGETEGGAYRYRFAGATCLAGDLLGEHAFDAPLHVGSRVVFPDMGAYSAVKSHWFNGVNLPTLYAIDATGQLSLVRRFGFDDFVNHCGGW
jgi:carboxynorspermidine decarboxylase